MREGVAVRETAGLLPVAETQAHQCSLGFSSAACLLPAMSHLHHLGWYAWLVLQQL